jgi:gluconate 5-dehydrogenase
MADPEIARIPPGPASLFDLSGQVAFVTGSSKGLGWAMAGALAAAGARVVLNARDATALERRRAELESAGLLGDHVSADITDRESGPAAIREVVRRHGRLDILVSNVAFNVRKPALEHSDEEFERVLAADLGTGFRLAREAGRTMVAAGHGRIVFTSSINGMIVRPGMVAYAAAKTGLFGLVRGLAAELSSQGVTVNAIAPGYFLTDGNAGTRQADPGFHDRIAARIPAGRWGDPRELAPALLALVSRHAGFTTGSVVTVDGGMTGAL